MHKHFVGHSIFQNGLWADMKYKGSIFLNTIVAFNVGCSTYTQKKNNPQLDMEDMALNKTTDTIVLIKICKIWYLIIYCDNWCDS